MSDHTYTTELAWSGTTGRGYRDYGRAHVLSLGETEIILSADAAFRGDAKLPNPEQLLLAAASSCQLLSFLAVAASAGVDVVGYSDSARAVMPAAATPMRITEIALRPTVRVRGADERTVLGLLDRAHEQCYVAHSLTAPVALDASVEVVA